jgi:RNA polymerase sigma-70 factor (ECF subfamily)
MTVSTDELIRRYQAGQTDLFEALFDRYKDYVYRVAFSLTRHVEEAEEVVQDTFLDLLRALPRYQVGGPARFETWLYRVTTNRCKMRWRRKRLPTADWEEVGEQIAQVPDERADHDPEHVTQERERRRVVWRAVGQLKDIYREVIVLRYGHELSYGEIAQRLDISIGTVKSRLNAAHHKLHEIIGDGGTDQAARPRRSRGGRIVLLLWTWLRIALGISPFRPGASLLESVPSLLMPGASLLRPGVSPGQVHPCSSRVCHPALPVRARLCTA